MHPLESLNEIDLGSLTRVADRLLNSRHLLAPGQKPDRLRAGFGIEFLDHREFSPGDDIRDIDWRTTARSRHPQIRRYRDEAAADWFILLDCSSSMAFANTEKWDLAVQCAAAMAYLLLHQGNRVSVLLFSDRVEQMIPLGRGNTHYAKILQTLRQTTLSHHGNGSELRSCLTLIKRNSPVFIISDFLTSNSMQDGLATLSLLADKLHALQIDSINDYQLPAQQNFQLKDVETGTSMTLSLDDSIQSQYSLTVTNYHNALTDFCRAKHIHFSRHTDAKSWKSMLINHLQATGSCLS